MARMASLAFHLTRGVSYLRMSPFSVEKSRVGNAGELCHNATILVSETYRGSSSSEESWSGIVESTLGWPPTSSRSMTTMRVYGITKNGIEQKTFGLLRTLNYRHVIIEHEYLVLLQVDRKSDYDVLQSWS
ncbi:hypothetical protein PISMIDRAFT_622245 [Pisolithus microcarpus 441]|uniref:Uncharacterized protein n=1 Tax=Pisolithus microcarpus 441 TaxID=765257 RepID=A0A0C9ZHQ1_9AGAM|nr:hypothetical protein PISMIDRAFT_622245 [Pisolithus microcarpus 441]